MGIEPTRATPLGLENKQFGAMTDPQCDGRVNFRGVGPRRDTCANCLAQIFRVENPLLTSLERGCV
jgi:hypothetical protein